MLHALLLQKFRKQLGLFNGHCAHQNGLTTIIGFFDRLGDCAKFVLRIFVELVVLVNALDWQVRWYFNNVELVDLMEFACFSCGGSRHARQLWIHAEIILECNGRQRLVFWLNLHAFFRLDGLVKPVRPAASVHHTTGKFVDDDNFTLFHNVINVAFEHHIGFERLVQMMHNQRVFIVIQV